MKKAYRSEILNNFYNSLRKEASVTNSMIEDLGFFVQYHVLAESNLEELLPKILVNFALGCIQDFVLNKKMTLQEAADRTKAFSDVFHSWILPTLTENPEIKNVDPHSYRNLLDSINQIVQTNWVICVDIAQNAYQEGLEYQNYLEGADNSLAMFG